MPCDDDDDGDGDDEYTNLCLLLPALSIHIFHTLTTPPYLPITISDSLFLGGMRR